MFIHKQISIQTNLKDLLWHQALNESATYVKPHLKDALVFGNRTELLDFAIKRITVKGLMLEFGVFQGASINYFAEKAPQYKWIGFDSFEGLAEDWTGHHATKGKFSLRGQLPKVHSNVTLIKGWFDKTVPEFFRINESAVSFLHIDADTYPAAKIILENSVKSLVNGSIIVFDEYLGYPGWLEGEYKAFKEISEKYSIKYKYIGFATNQCVLQITEDSRAII